MPTGEDSTNLWRPMFGAIVVGIGLLSMVVMFIVTLNNFEEAKDAVAVLGVVTGVVGTVVTAFFGIHATASAGSDAAKKVAAAGSDAAAKATIESSEAAARVAAANELAIGAAAFIDPDKAPMFLHRLGIVPE